MEPLVKAEKSSKGRMLSQTDMSRTAEFLIDLIVLSKGDSRMFGCTSLKITYRFTITGGVAATTLKFVTK